MRKNSHQPGAGYTSTITDANAVELDESDLDAASGAIGSFRLGDIEGVAIRNASEPAKDDVGRFAQAVGTQSGPKLRP